MKDKLNATASHVRVYIVEAEHWHIAGRRMSAFSTAERADAAALELALLLATEHNRVFEDAPVAVPTAGNWQATVDQLQDYHGAANVGVWVSDLEVKE